MQHPKFSNEDMFKRIVRFSDLRQGGTPLMFIDSVIPGHRRMNYAVVGDTASENPDYRPALTDPHSFQIGMVMAPPGNGPAYHTHDYIEAFMPLSGHWRFCWGNDPEGAPEGETVVGPWDWISLPPGLDGLYIGPGDPSMSLGGRQRVDLTEPKLVEALDAILAAARRHGRVAGLHTNSPDYARRMIDRGFRFVTVMTDTALLASAAQSLVAAVRGDTPGAPAQPAGPY
jgi:hypothetical protein